MTKVDHFIPLIGPFIMATDRLKSQGKDFENNNIHSFPAFSNNEQHINYNYPQYSVSYLPESLEGSTIEQYREYRKTNNIESGDIICAVPPCAGLSMLNVQSNNSSSFARGSDAVQNRWMYESVKWFLSSDAKILVIENAPALARKSGLGVLKNIHKILIDNNLDKKYKIHLTKTTTLNHGLPQTRNRAFLFLYKSKKYRRLKAIHHNTPTLEQFLQRPEQEDEALQHFVFNINYYDKFYQFLKHKGLFDTLRNEFKDQTVVSTGIWEYMLNKYKDDPNYFDTFTDLKDNADFILSKKEKGLGFWDASPVFAKGKVNAIVSKNAYRIIHPRYDRYLTVRELMDLMGLPEGFKLVNPKSHFNHICQNVPINTAADHLLWAQAIIDENSDLIVDSFEDDSISLFIQNNLKKNPENDLETVNSTFTDFVKYEIGGKTENKFLKSFFEV